jgi:5'-3' exonuclease
MEVATMNGMLGNQKGKSRKWFQNLSLSQSPVRKKIHTQKKPNAFASSMKVTEFLYIYMGSSLAEFGLVILISRKDKRKETKKKKKKKHLFMHHSD